MCRILLISFWDYFPTIIYVTLWILERQEVFRNNLLQKLHKWPIHTSTSICPFLFIFSTMIEQTLRWLPTSTAQLEPCSELDPWMPVPFWCICKFSRMMQMGGKTFEHAVKKGIKEIKIDIQESPEEIKGQPWFPVPWLFSVLKKYFLRFSPKNQFSW